MIDPKDGVSHLNFPEGFGTIHKRPLRGREDRFYCWNENNLHMHFCKLRPRVPKCVTHVAQGPVRKNTARHMSNIYLARFHTKAVTK